MAYRIESEKERAVPARCCRLPLCALIGTLMLCCPVAIRAQEAQDADAPERPWWVIGQVEYVSVYYYRGFFQEDDNPIVQPAMKAGYEVYQSDGWFTRAAPVVGFRASLHASETAATEDPGWVYELDLLGGMQFTFLERVKVEALYVTIRGPGGAFPTIREVDVNLEFDDMGLWPGDFAIKPFADFKTEVDGSAAGGGEGTMVEIGVKPEFGLIKSRAFPLRVIFPVAVGLSIDDYYSLPAFGPFPAVPDQTLGYLKSGVTFLLPLTFVPPEAGQWAFTAGVDYIFLNDNLETFNGGKESDVIGRFGFVFRY